MCVPAHDLKTEAVKSITRYCSPHSITAILHSSLHGTWAIYQANGSFWWTSCRKNTSLISNVFVNSSFFQLQVWHTCALHTTAGYFVFNSQHVTPFSISICEWKPGPHMVVVKTTGCVLSTKVQVGPWVLTLKWWNWQSCFMEKPHPSPGACLVPKYGANRPYIWLQGGGHYVTIVRFDVGVFQDSYFTNARPNSKCESKLSKHTIPLCIFKGAW